jgi:hypothetical protein
MYHLPGTVSISDAPIAESSDAVRILHYRLFLCLLTVCIVQKVYVPRWKDDCEL